MRKFLITTASIVVAGLVVFAIIYTCTLLSPFTFSQGHTGSITQIDYTDFIAILLTGVTVVLAALGFVVAILAFIGWNSIKDRVNDQTESAIRESLKEDGKLRQVVQASLLVDGELYKLVQKEAFKIIYRGIGSVNDEDEDYSDDEPEVKQ